MSDIQKIIEEKTKYISLITNQIVTTIYSKDKSIAKLLNTVSDIKVEYVLEDCDDDTFLLQENKTIVVTRKNDSGSKCRLVAKIYDINGEHLLDKSWDLVLLAKDDAAELKLDELRYNNNKLSQMFGYIGIVFILIATIITLNTIKPNFMTSFIYILSTIAIFLVGFLASEKVKVYNKNYSYIFIAFGIISIALIFWLPLGMVVKYNQYTQALAAGDSNASSILTNYFGAAIKPNTSDANMLTQNGAIRGIWLIVLYILSAAAFFFSGITSYLKTVKLENYLKKIGLNK